MFKLDVDEPAGLMLIPEMVAPLTARMKGMSTTHSMVRVRRGNEVSKHFVRFKSKLG